MSETNEWKKEFLNRLLEFAVNIVLLANKLPKTPAGFVIAQQIIKSGTSIGANAAEAQDASSAKDFLQKLTIALREAKETAYWLLVIERTKLLDKSDMIKEVNECNEITAILVSSIKKIKHKDL